MQNEIKRDYTEPNDPEPPTRSRELNESSAEKCLTADCGDFTSLAEESAAKRCSICGEPIKSRRDTCSGSCRIKKWQLGVVRRLLDEFYLFIERKIKREGFRF